MDQFIAEIRIFPFNFAPQGWAMCNGQLLPISQNTALFSLLGTYYGGNGSTTFGLPNLQGRGSIQQGQGPGLSMRSQGETGGSGTVTLLSTEMPAHTHAASGKAATGQIDPTAGVWGTAGTSRPAPNFYATTAPNVLMNPNALSAVGGSQPHNNLMPFLGLNFCIAMQGIFPSRG